MGGATVVQQPSPNPQPSLTNFGNLLNVRNMYEQQLADKGAYWHLINSAVGPRVSLVKFPRSCGTTLCQVAENVRLVCIARVIPLQRSHRAALPRATVAPRTRLFS